MSNPQKNKGDKAEREAVTVLTALAADLLVPNVQRKLGAGRREDVGDLHAFPDVAVQVRAVANLGVALRSAAVDSLTQAGHGGMTFAVGMVPVQRARKDSVRWLASCLSWPGGAPDGDEIAVFGNPAQAVAHLRRENLGIPRSRRLVLLRRANAVPVYVAPVEAWLSAYRQAATAVGETVASAAHVSGESRHQLAAAG